MINTIWLFDKEFGPVALLQQEFQSCKWEKGLNIKACMYWFPLSSHYGCVCYWFFGQTYNYKLPQFSVSSHRVKLFMSWRIVNKHTSHNNTKNGIDAFRHILDNVFATVEGLEWQEICSRLIE